ncbi:SIMPL domain-containing protein [Aidingimonas lacisalsi]|uniref:SIMPL domain-containing protein n=1 Tax=Aidingimonas lacisalsi TaxID=2604086 RepID=UPI001F24B045|nr:SIMPL domain-containing protein [Aidingimonas lacisalsi]
MTCIRMTRTRPSALRWCATLLVMTSLTLSGAQAAEAEEKMPRTLDLQAQATVTVTPDNATLNARLWERTEAVAVQDDQQTDPDALQQARQRLETRTGELIRRLEDTGLERDDISAGSLNIRPERIHPATSDDESEPMVRTQVERAITLDITELDTLPTILDALTEAGVNALDGIQYDLADRDDATHDALRQALEKARHKAELMADTLDVELGQVLSVQETQSPVFTPRRMALQADAMESQSGSEAEYRPGTISIDAGVQVSWEIAP